MTGDAREDELSGGEPRVERRATQSRQKRASRLEINGWPSALATPVNTSLAPENTIASTINASLIMPITRLTSTNLPRNEPMRTLRARLAAAPLRSRSAIRGAA